MYPYSQASAYEIKNGVFSPCSADSAASNCPPCISSSKSDLSSALLQLGLFKFSKIVEISGLKNISCTGCTVFAPRDDDIDDYYVQNCTRLDAVKIVKSSIMPNIVPIEVLLQRGKAKYPTINIMTTLTIGEVQVDYLLDSGTRKTAKALALLDENGLTDTQDKFVSIGKDLGIIEATYPPGNVIVKPNLQGENKKVLVHIIQNLILNDCLEI